MTFGQIIDHSFVDAPCPACDYALAIQLLDARIGRRIHCPNCKVPIQLVDDRATMHSAVDSVNRIGRELEQRIRDIGR